MKGVLSSQISADDAPESPSESERTNTGDQATRDPFSMDYDTDAYQVDADVIDESLSVVMLVAKLIA